VKDYYFKFYYHYCIAK